MNKMNNTLGKIYTCPMHPEVTSDKPGKCPKCGMSLVQKGKKTDHSSMDHGQEAKHAESSGLYTCPMDPDVISDKPGNCPKCGMKLVPMMTTEHGGHEEHTSMEYEFHKRFYNLTFRSIYHATFPKYSKVAFFDFRIFPVGT